MQNRSTSYEGKFKRRPCTHEEKERVLSYFKTCVEMQKLPGKEEYSMFLVLHPNHFKGRNWLHTHIELDFETWFSIWSLRFLIQEFIRVLRLKLI
ncbi:hypothetical protein Avbf_11422 [Armadillidium vulgare]|nr:hypothetical protein Avbf_11422 [Armadillidium vulgare]